MSTPHLALERTKMLLSGILEDLMSNVLGVLRGVRLYIVGYAKQSFFAFRHLVKFDCFATLYKSLSFWAEALKLL